jgi:hypothetical protein
MLVSVVAEDPGASSTSNASRSESRRTLVLTIGRLLEYCQRNDWAGYDPYDALNSPLFAHKPLARSKVCRLAAIQALKRCPVNFRPLLAVTRGQNPKALALFLMALVRLRRHGTLGERVPLSRFADRLAALRSSGSRHWCWGYSFPWQTRTELVPRFAPNVVCTAFVGNALLDLFQVEPQPRYLAMAVGAADYLTRELFWREPDGAAGFSYPSPPSHTRVHNASLIGAAFLCRVHKYHEDDRFMEAALIATRYAVSVQKSDGSWPYGASPTQAWIDNFHTGYNLCALHAIGRDTNTSEFDSQLRSGFDFYCRHFFNPDSSPRYFHDRTYPIDIHSVAQSIVTLVTLRHLYDEGIALADAVYRWAMDRMWDAGGYFYYRVHRLGTNRIPYMRWSQAWMLLALATLLVEPSSSTEPIEAEAAS